MGPRLTRSAATAQERLFCELAGPSSDGAEAEAVLASPGFSRAALTLCNARGEPVLTALQWAAAFAVTGAPVLKALVAAGCPLDDPLPPAIAPPALLDLAGSGPVWMQEFMDRQLTSARRAALLPGMTPLSIACRLGHTQTVGALLQLGADPDAVGTVPQSMPKPFTPLSAVILSSDGSGGAGGPAAAQIARRLLQAGADPLAPSSRRRCSTLRCACGSEFLPNQTLPLLLDHLEAQLDAGCLALGSGDAAAEVMVAAARCCRLRLFNVAHEYVLATAGLRQLAAEPRGGAAGVARRRGVDSSSSSGSSSSGEEDADMMGGHFGSGEVGPEDAADMDWLDRLARGDPPRWRPSQQQLFEVLRSAALGGSADILRAILRSPLSFNVAETDAVGKGLMAHSAAHAGSLGTVRLLHQAGAQLDLPRLLYVLEKTVAPAPVQALLTCQQPQVPADRPTIKAGGVTSFTCPIHRLLHIFKRGSPVATARGPAVWAKDVMVLLEVLLAAGYRPAVYRGMPQSHRTFIMQDGVPVRVADPFDPFDYYPASSVADRRLLLVARGTAWNPAVHPDWPEAFKLAVRTFLLAAHRMAWEAAPGSDSAAQRAARAERAARRQRGKGPRLVEGQVAALPALPASLASLPAELLLSILGVAASPVSAWM